MIRSAVIIPGHGLKQSWDPGAQADIDGDGVIRQDETEAHLVREYADLAARALTWQGWTVHTFDRGTYTQRNQLAAHVTREADLVAVLYCHIDSYQGQPHALVGHIAESPLGGRLAQHVAEGLGDCLPPTIGKVRVKAYSKSEPEQWGRNGRSVLAPSFGMPAHVAGVLLEPFPIQALIGLNWDGIRPYLLGVADGLVAGLEAWSIEAAAQGGIRR